MRLKELKTGQSAVITAVGGEGRLRQHFLDMGVIPGTQVTLVKLAPMGDPMQLTLHDYELSLRLADAEKIEIEPIEKTAPRSYPKKSKRDHPGFGEGGKFHPKGSGDPLPDDTTLTYALVGNQNSGKTTLFNQLTGSNQHVGNFPGVTVDRKDGVIKGYKNTLITDLPGIYSMSPYTNEEIVSRSFVLDEKPRAIINIVDATNIERNLYLTMQLLEMDTPVRQRRLRRHQPTRIPARRTRGADLRGKESGRRRASQARDPHRALSGKAPAAGLLLCR